jgi:hypothetical protein
MKPKLLKEKGRIMILALVAATVVGMSSACYYNTSPPCPGTDTTCPNGTGFLAQCVSSDVEFETTRTNNGTSSYEVEIDVTNLCEEFCYYYVTQSLPEACGSYIAYFPGDVAYGVCISSGSGS